MNNEQVQQIFVEDIIPNRFQPRLTFDEKALEELANSIKEHGIIQPLVLRRVGNKYEIIAGERRYKASCMAGLKTVPAIVRELDDTESAEVAIIENIQRKDLTSIEEAQSYRNLLDHGYMTQEELATKLGVSQSTIANKLRLLNLCDEVQNALLNEQISERHARSLLQLQKIDDQKAMLDRIIKERLTVKQLDDEIKKLLGNNGSSDSDEGTVITPISEVTEDMLNQPIQGEKNKESEIMADESNEPRKNIFGMEIVEPTDLESTPANLDTQVNDTIPPVSFNPFTNPIQHMTTDANDQADVKVENNNTDSISDNEQIETFDMFGDIFTSTNNVSENQDGELNVNTNKNIGEEINKVRESIKSVETDGYMVEMEEYDFEDMYQIVVKIKK